MNSQHDENSLPSFLTESGNAAAGEKTIPLGVGEINDVQALDPLANVSEGKKLTAGSFVIVLVVVVACAGIWFMRSLSKVGAATTGNTDIEASIEKFLTSLKGNSGAAAAGANGKPSTALSQGDASVLAVLSGSYTERQVPLNSVQRDPFVIYGEVATPSGPVDAGIGDEARRRAEKQATFEKAAAHLELKSVLMSSQPLANVSGKIVRVGDEVVADDTAFRVADISKDAVTLIGEDAKLNLSVPVTLILKR